jgi:hypothetical protein
MWNDYADLSLQHYVCGRFAGNAGLLPLCGNLVHHAIELQLKCGLIKAGAIPGGANLRLTVRLRLAVQHLLAKVQLSSPPPDNASIFLKKRYGHSLRKLWRDFKQYHPTEDLSAFDRLLKELDRWEDIRYPQRGIAIHVQALSAQRTPTPTGTAMKGIRTFTMNAQDIDEFAQRLWKLMSVDPNAFMKSRMPSVGASAWKDDKTQGMYV